MHSSTSSSERAGSAERLTAADRPGVAQPVPERPVPARPWRGIFAIALLLLVALTAMWEWRMRQLQLLPGDLDDGPSAWAEQRRRLDAGDVPVAIVGDSRALFDTNLAHFEALTGIKPVQLALVGTNARPFLQNVAADPDFRGLVIVGITERSYFREGIGLNATALERYRFESPAVRGSYLIHRELSRVFGFLDENYRLSKLMMRLDRSVMPGVRTPYAEVWKVGTFFDDRQMKLWPRLKDDPFLVAHAKVAWRAGVIAGPPVTEPIRQMTFNATRDAVAAIRARGGDVVFIRPPSAASFRAEEDGKISRERGWDPLLVAANVRGIHADDDPVMHALVPPEDSHLSAECAVVFTDAYVRQVATMTDKLKLRAGAPPPMAASDCTW